jgi:hypothetical protein
MTMLKVPEGFGAIHRVTLYRIVQRSTMCNPSVRYHPQVGWRHVFACVTNFEHLELVPARARRKSWRAYELGRVNVAGLLQNVLCNKHSLPTHALL